MSTAIRDFPHGIHPAEGKELAQDCPIEVLPTPKEVRLALQQHLGAPAKPVVKPRQEVVVGDPIGEAGAFISAPVHASIAGKTAAGTVANLPNGRHVEVIPIKRSDAGQLEGRALFEACFGGDWDIQEILRTDYGPDDIAEAALDAGLVGLGGAAFPTHVKLRRNPEKPIDHLLINGAECEPFLTANHRLLLEAPHAVVAGATLAMRATQATSVSLCIESNKQDVVRRLQEAAAGTGIEIVVLPTKYPQGGEKQLIYAVTGRAVPVGALPLEVGVVVMNVATCAALAGAVLRGRPLTHNIVTVTGRGITEPKNLLVPIGTAYGELVAHCGGLRDDAARVVAGGPMMGFTMGNLGAPTTKGTSGVTVLTHEDLRQATETTCIRCGRCVDACPMQLVPTRIAMAARAGDLDQSKAWHIDACMECGCCAYTCPASIPLVQLIRVGKTGLRNRPRN
ncbi:MAG: electron transport complex subunit RsxC [Planctomycetota bacterium]